MRDALSRAWAPETEVEVLAATQKIDVYSVPDPRARPPREIPLRYDPPVPWYRRTWFYAAVGTAVGVTGGVSVH